MCIFIRHVGLVFFEKYIVDVGCNIRGYFDCIGSLERNDLVNLFYPI